MNDKHISHDLVKNIFFIAFVWIISHSCQSDAHQERHNVYYRFTVLTKAGTFPPFSAVGVCDDRRIKHYSNELEDWIRANVIKHDNTEPLQEPHEPRDWYKDLLKTLSNCTNPQCSELHVLQRITGCKLEKLPDGTVKSLTAYDEYGFDGEDFISFNSDTVQWIDKNPKAKETKKEWDLKTERKQFLKNYLEKCVHKISTYNNTNMSQPDVHVFARKVPDDDSNLVLTCLATGFYPRDVEMYIRLNRNILEDQTSSGIRPNDDETFQMRSSVTINRNYKVSYDCLLIHSSLTASVKWDGRCFNCESEPPWPVIGGAVAVLVVLVLVIIVISYYLNNRRNSNGRVRNSSSNGPMTDQIQMTSPASADVIRS